jgi:hypothetical protein
MLNPSLKFGRFWILTFLGSLQVLGFVGLELFCVDLSRQLGLGYQEQNCPHRNNLQIKKIESLRQNTFGKKNTIIFVDSYVILEPSL